MSVDFAAIERKYGLPPGYLHRTMMLESSGRVDAKNPNSSALGPFQFIRSTAKQYNLTDPTNLAQSADAAARLARDNAPVLRRALGREPTAAELYLAHQQGGGGAARMLSSPNARAAGVVGDDAIRLNAGRADQTAGAFAQKWVDKFNKTSGGNALADGGGTYGEHAAADDRSDPRRDNALAMLERVRFEPMQVNALSAPEMAVAPRMAAFDAPADFQPRSVRRYK